MSWRKFLPVALWLLFLPLPAAAHKLNVIAWPSGGEIQGEVSSSDGDPADGSNVQIVVQNAATHAVLLETKSDAKGGFRFDRPVPAQDILLIADAGQGHRGEQLLSAADYAAPSAGTGSPAMSPSGCGAAAVNEDLLRRIVAEESSRALAPLRRTLAEMQERHPDFRDILGGIGWIFGLAGLVAWFRSRKR